MQYSVEEIKQYAAEEDVKFIRMAFCDAAGRQKNIAIMPEELDRAFQYGIAIDGSAIPGTTRRVREHHRRPDLRHSRLRRGGPL